MLMRKKLYLSLVVIPLLCVCCRQRGIVRFDSGPVTSKMPSAIVAQTSQSELDSLYHSDPDYVIDYRVARYLASADLLGGSNIALGFDPYIPWRLTEFPKVVYNYDNTPKYYEFGYMIDSCVVATVTTYARKETDAVIAYLFSNPLDYSCPDLDFYVGEYPDRYYGSGGVCYLKNCDEELGFVPESSTGEDEQVFSDMFEAIPSADKGVMANDVNGASIVPAGELRQNRDDFWAAVDAFVENHRGTILSDDNAPGYINLSQMQGGGSGSGNNDDVSLIAELADYLDYTVGYCDTFTLPRYRDPRLQLTFWSGYCGPAACAWVYRGLKVDYNGDTLPLYGDAVRSYFKFCPGTCAYYDFIIDGEGLSRDSLLTFYRQRSETVDNGLSWQFYQRTTPTYWGEWYFPLYEIGMRNGIKAVTNNEYTIKFTVWPTKWINEKQQPVIIEVDCNHYVVAFGTATTRKQNGKVNKKYFMVTDNSSKTSEHNYMPYMKYYNGWNLHYGLALNNN